MTRKWKEKRWLVQKKRKQVVFGKMAECRKILTFVAKCSSVVVIL